MNIMGDVLKLSKNEKKMISILVKEGNISDVEISKKMKISPAGVGKIKKKLEEKGVIKGYNVNIDYKKLGINVFCIMLVRIDTSEKAYSRDVKSLEDVLSMPNMIKLYRLPRSTVTHLVVSGFRNVVELDNYIQDIQANYPRHVEIREVYVISEQSILKDNPEQLITWAIDNWEDEAAI